MKANEFRRVSGIEGEPQETVICDHTFNPVDYLKMNDGLEVTWDRLPMLAILPGGTIQLQQKYFSCQGYENIVLQGN